MYNEKAFKNHIFWMKVKRVFLIIVFAMAGALAGVMISDVVINVLLLNMLYKTPIIVISTLLMVALSLLLTAGTGAAVQDAYWKMALMRKVIVISKKLDNVSVVANEELDEMIDTLNEFEVNQESEEIKKNKKSKERKLKNKPKTTLVKEKITTEKEV